VILFSRVIPLPPHKSKIRRKKSDSTHVRTCPRDSYGEAFL